MMIYAWVLAAAACVASYAGSMRWLKIKHETYDTDKDAGFHVLHISDLHANRLTRANERMWERIHALQFDMVAITGDLLQWRLGELEPVKPHLRRLAARAPVFFVDGNHERHIYADVYRALETLGITPLENKRVRVQINGSEIEVVGVADYYRLKKERFLPIRRAFAFRSKELFTLVLSHQPSVIDHITRYSPDLMLCGHTHGGQVRIPFLPALYAPAQGLFPRYDHGWYREKDTDFFVSKGIGATHFHIRLFNRPEVAVIEVRRQKE